MCDIIYVMIKMFFMIFTDIIQFFYEYRTNAFIISVSMTGAYCFFENIYKACFSEDSNDVRCSLYKIGKIFLLIFYIYMVIGITILSRSESGTREGSFRIFRTFSNTFFARKQIYENIIMFIPYAVLLYSLAWTFRRLWVCVLIGMGSSLLIEVTQWITRTGYFELDDIMLNTMGMLIGYMICLLVEQVYKKEIKRNF